MPLASYLGRRGYRISILMPGHKPREKGYALENAKNVIIYETGIPFFRKIKQGRKNYSTLALCKIAFQNIIKSIRLLMRLNPDIIMLCKALPAAGTVGLFFKIVKGKKIILDCDDAETEINFVRSNLQRRVINTFETVLPKLAVRILTNTEYNLKRIKMRGICDDKIAYIPNGVDVRRFSNIYRKPALEKELGGSKIILYYGDLNFASGHNIDILLEAFKIFLPKYPLAKLLIIGDGTDEGKLKELALKLDIESNMIWKERLPPEDVPNYVMASSVLVDPVRDVLSNLARCPIKIIEAMYLGKPVVTSDIGDRKKLLGEFGFFAEEGNPNSLAEKILEALENEEFQKNRGLVIQRALDYSWDKLTDKVEVLLSEIETK